MEFHKRKGGICSIALSEVANPSQYGVVLIDNDNKIVGFQEKPLAGEERSKLANTGIYIFEPEIFNHIPYNVFYDLEEICSKLLEIPYYGYKHLRYWNDVGSLERSTREFDTLEGKVEVKIPGVQQIRYLAGKPQGGRCGNDPYRDWQ